MLWQLAENPTTTAAAAAHLGGGEAREAGAYNHDVKHPAVVDSLCSVPVVWGGAA